MCHHTRAFLVLLSQALILFPHQINGRFVTGVEEKQKTALLDKQISTWELASGSPFPQQPSCKQGGWGGGKRQELEGRWQRLTLEMLFFRELWKSHMHFHTHTHKGCYLISGVMAISPNSTALTVLRPLPVLNSKGISRSFVTQPHWPEVGGGRQRETVRLLFLHNRFLTL